MKRLMVIVLCAAACVASAGEAVWIGDRGNDAPAFEKAFTFEKPVASAELRISGLGFYEAYLNGRRVGDRELEPTPTDYTKRVYYSTYDLTREIAATNVIRVLLGNGWYNSAETGVWRFDKAPWRDFPRLWADLAVTFADGSRTNVVTDATWSVAPSPVLFNDFREGEIIRSESRPLPPLKALRRVQVVSAPKGRLVPETHEPARVVERIRPVAIEKFGDGWILDFGKNLAGRMRMDVRGAKEGDVVSFRYDERKPPAERHIDCYIRALPSTNAWTLADAGYQTDRFICNGDAHETYAPRFTYHGFRYVLVRGLRTAPAAEDARAEFIRTGYATTGSSLLRTSDETFNRLIRAAALAYDGNFTDGFPTDCPHREKNGWLADATLTATFGLYRAGTENALRDWVRLIGESQRPNGSVPCIVPDFGWEYDGHSCCNSGPGWGTALTTLPTILHRIRGERDFLVEMYPSMRRYCECLWKDLKDGLIVDGLPDWMAAKLLEPDKCWTPRTPAKLTSTAYAYRSFLETASAADLAGASADAAELRRWADVVKAAFNREFRRGGGVYHEGWACGQAFALNFGLVDAKDVEGARRQLVKAVHAEDDHIDFGMLGTSVVFRELSKAGETALAYKMIMNTAPSFADWIRSGDTTLREDFPGKLSRNHPSFGDFAAWAYEYVLGVRAVEPGYRKFVFDPQVQGLPLTYADGTVLLAKGLRPIEASWRRDAVRGEIACRLVVPHGTKAEVPRLGKTLGPGAHEFALPSEPDARAGEISDHAAAGSRVRVACIGDSITYGYAMTNRTAECYPVQLARLLGEDYEVRNFGDPGAGVYTHSKAFGGKGPRSWALRGNLDKALAFKPDIVVSNLGINDVDEYAKEFLPDPKTGRTGLERGRFVREYVELLERFRAQNKDVRILIWTRLGPCMKVHRLKGNALPFVMSEDLEKVAKAAGAEGMDMYAPLLPLSETADFCADGIHPEGGACRVIAAETAKALGRKAGR